MSDFQPASVLELGLFTGIPQHENFARLPDMFPTRKMNPSQSASHWPTSHQPLDLPSQYMFEGRSKVTSEFLSDTDTAALLVLKKGEIIHEQYSLSGGPEVPWLSMSVAKSFVSAMIGIAIDEGHIASLTDPVSKYAHVESGSAYDGVSIKDVLQMSSGARWNEDYSDPTADIFRLTNALAGRDGTLTEFIATMAGENKPGTVCRYNSADTQALGSVLTSATKMSLSDYMQSRICEPLGMSSPSYWLIDPAGMEVAFAGLMMTARDFAKLGELYRNNGIYKGRQVVPSAWVRASIVSDSPHLGADQVIVGDHPFGFGYGYQWWILEGTRSEFSAIGVYNQFVFVDPTSEVTIVKLSANHLYGTSSDESTNREHETMALFRAICQN